MSVVLVCDTPALLACILRVLTLLLLVLQDSFRMRAEADGAVASIDAHSGGKSPGRGRGAEAETESDLSKGAQVINPPRGAVAAVPTDDDAASQSHGTEEANGTKASADGVGEAEFEVALQQALALDQLDDGDGASSAHSEHEDAAHAELLGVLDEFADQHSAVDDGKWSRMRYETVHSRSVCRDV